MLTRAGHVLIPVLCALLAACGSTAPAPVEDRNTRSPDRAPTVSTSQSTYRVQGGDTLYSIAFRYGLDFRKVAAANSIAAPYTIYPGQSIVLREAPVPRAPAPAAKPKAPTKTKTSTPKPTATAVPAPKTTASTSKPKTTYTGAAVSKWNWPTTGRVTRRYSANKHKGIDIGGRRGDAVNATAPGKVVYAGTGILGYGALLIVKHNEQYLSAYGHNDDLLVKEGQVVAAGETIARKGSSGTDTVKLHFQIRKEGKPIDPQRVLPAR